jgi:hypothetical protein
MELWSGHEVVAAWLSICVVIPGIALFGFSLRNPRNRFLLKYHLRSKFGGVFAPNDIPTEPWPERTAADVERIVKRDFPTEEFANAMAILNEYKPRYNDSPFSVQLAALRLANGDVPRLRSAIESAKSDFRDVILWAVYPSYIKSGRNLSERQRRRMSESDRQQFQEWLSR